MVETTFTVWPVLNFDPTARTRRRERRRSVAAGLLVAGAALSGCTAERPVVVRTATVAQPGPSLIPVSFRVGESATGNYLAGRFAHKSYDYHAATDYFSRALGREGVGTELLRRAFLSSLADGRFSNAKAMARRIVADNANAPIANIVLAVADIHAGKLVEAERRLKRVKRRGLNTFLRPLLRGWIAVGRGNPEAAIKAFAPLASLSAFAVLRDLHAGLAYDVAERPTEAEKHFNAAAERAKQPTLRVVQALGSLYERTGRGVEALVLYDRYLKRNPESRVLRPARARAQAGGVAPRLVSDVREGVAEAFFNIASTLEQENASEMALIYGRMALRLRPQLALAKMLVGGILESLGRQHEAIEVYGSVEVGSPLRWSARLRVAASLDALGQDEEAIRELRAMAAESSARPDVLINLGDILRAKKRFSESVDAYDAAVKRIGRIDKRHWTLLYSRGISLERSKRWARAEEDFLAALKLNPEQPYVLNYLGYSWVDQGLNLKRARKMIERAVELRPNDGYIVDSLGWMLYRAGNFKDAVRHLERAVELRPQDPTINDHLGDAYWRVGRSIESRFQWRRALSLDPERDQITTIQKKIADGLNVSGKPDKGT